MPELYHESTLYHISYDKVRQQQFNPYHAPSKHNKIICNEEYLVHMIRLNHSLSPIPKRLNDSFPVQYALYIFLNRGGFFSAAAEILVYN